MFSLTSEQRIDRPLEQVFPFFADARNLEAITPRWLSFSILTEGDLEMAVGTRIDYRLRMRGLPLRWQSEITAWEPPYRFVDEQRRGPYRRWVHEHTFEADGDATWVRDRVEYDVLGGRLVNTLLVRRDLDRIFAFRRERLIEVFG
jgi:ligand-binding SRPBCC domain-containing protein